MIDASQFLYNSNIPNNSEINNIQNRINEFLTNKYCPDTLRQQLAQYILLNPPLPHHNTQMIYACLKAKICTRNKELTCKQIICGLTNTPLQSSDELIFSLFCKEEYEAALAYGAMHPKNEYCLSKKVQNVLKNKMTFRGVLKYTLQHTEGEVQEISLAAFISYGAERLINENDLNGMHVIRECDFIKTLFKIKLKLPPKAIHALLNKLVFPFEKLHIENDQQDKIRKSLLRNFYLLIPDEYAFNDNLSCLNELKEIYKKPLRNDKMIPSLDQKGMTKDQTNAFINRLQEFPHPGLIKSVVVDILDRLYLENPSMEHFWLSFYRIEKAIGVQRVKTFIDRATETYICQLLESGKPDLFINKVESKLFSFAVLQLFMKRPEWLDENGYCHYEIYECVIKLLMNFGHKVEARVLVKSIRNQNIKEQLNRKG